MIPYYKMQESVERARTNSEAYAQTERDVDAALAADPAGPPKDLVCQPGNSLVAGRLLDAFECSFKQSGATP
jgi:hypothetical protein